MSVRAVNNTIDFRQFSESFRLTCLHVSFSQKAAQWRARNGLARFELPRAPQSAKFLLRRFSFAS